MNGCTCTQVWMSVLPPPPCPVHSAVAYVTHIVLPVYTNPFTPRPIRGKYTLNG